MWKTYWTWAPKLLIQGPRNGSPSEAPDTPELGLFISGHLNDPARGTAVICLSGHCTFSRWRCSPKAWVAAWRRYFKGQSSQSRSVFGPDDLSGAFQHLGFHASVSVMHWCWARVTSFEPKTKWTGAQFGMLMALTSILCFNFWKWSLSLRRVGPWPSGTFGAQPHCLCLLYRAWKSWLPDCALQRLRANHSQVNKHSPPTSDLPFGPWKVGQGQNTGRQEGRSALFQQPAISHLVSLLCAELILLLCSFWWR